jgi:hypothetical protein
MNNKALYWIALGVFALGLHSEYQKGSLPFAHRIAVRAEATFCGVVARAEQTWALARVLTGHQNFPVDDQFLARQQAEVERVMGERQADLDRVMAEHQADIDHAMDLRQADLDRVQQKLDHMHIVSDRVQVDNLRKVERVRFKLAEATSRRLVICPQTGVRVVVGAQPDDADIAVDVNDAQ